MEFSFKRSDSSDIYFSDIDLKLSNSVKYDLYNDSNLSGTLITNYSRTFAKFREGVCYKRHDKSWRIPSYEHILLNEFERPFVRITIDIPLYRIDEVAIAFYDGSPTNYFNRNNFHTKKEGIELTIDIKSGNQTVFMLKNVRKSNDSMRPMEGTIEIADGLHRDKIFGFLLAIQLYYENCEARR